MLNLHTMTGPTENLQSSGAPSRPPPPSSTELMIALSQIQQLVPLLDYRPPTTVSSSSLHYGGPTIQAGLSHLIPSLLTPLGPITSSDQPHIQDSLALAMGLPNVTQAATQESIKRHRASVDHAMRIASELIYRLGDQNGVGGALQLADHLMRKQQDETQHDKTNREKERIIRVRKKRRMLSEQEKMAIQGVDYQQHVTGTTSNGDDVDDDEMHLEGSLVSRNATVDPATLPSIPTDSFDIHTVSSYLCTFRAYVAALPLEIIGISPKLIRVRLSKFEPQATTTTTTATTFRISFDLEMKNILRAKLDVSIVLPAWTVSVTRINVLAAQEDLTEINTPSQYPHFRSLSSSLYDKMLRISRQLAQQQQQQSGWNRLILVTESLLRIFCAGAEFHGLAI